MRQDPVCGSQTRCDALDLWLVGCFSTLPFSEFVEPHNGRERIWARKHCTTVVETHTGTTLFAGNHA